MSSTVSAIVLACFGATLILITLSLWLFRRTAPAGDSYSTGARFFLVALRLAIGWHCFVEGMEKLHTPAWSSEAYLRESVGPFSSFYRGLAGDRLIDKLTVGPSGEFPAELDREWREYLAAFAAHYDLNAEQLQRAEEILKEREADAPAAWKKPEPVTKIAPYPPDLVLDMTMQDRLKEHERLLNAVLAEEAKFPCDDKGIHAKWKTAKADLAKWRGELKKAVDAQTDKLKRTDEPAREKSKKTVGDLTAKLDKAKTAADKDKLQKEIDAEKAKIWLTLRDVLTSEQKLQAPLAEPIVLPVGSWRLLEWGDFGVKWGLLVLGGCLMLGLLSRVSSLATAALIFSFYLAMPPLPGWPDSPRLEGHYLIINKTLIEVIALLALAFIPTGRWAGLDALLQWALPSCCGGCCATKPPAPPADKPAA